MQKRDFETYQKRLWDFGILTKFYETHVFRGTICHPYNAYNFEPERFFFFGTLPLLGGGGEIKEWTQSWWRVELWVLLVITLYTFHGFLLLGFFEGNNAKYALQSNIRMIKNKTRQDREKKAPHDRILSACHLTVF